MASWRIAPRHRARAASLAVMSAQRIRSPLVGSAVRPTMIIREDREIGHRGELASRPQVAALRSFLNEKLRLRTENLANRSLNSNQLFDLGEGPVGRTRNCSAAFQDFYTSAKLARRMSPFPQQSELKIPLLTVLSQRAGRA